MRLDKDCCFGGFSVDDQNILVGILIENVCSRNGFYSAADPLNLLKCWQTHLGLKKLNTRQSV